MNRQQSKTHRLVSVISFGLILLTFGAGSLFSQPAKSPWRLQRLPLDETITGISFPTTADGYLVTSGGKYVVTHDGGSHWNAYHLQGAPAFEDIYFKSRDTGLAVGRQGAIYRTINGAKDWEKRPSPDTLTWFTSALFLNDTVALVAGFRPDESRVGKLYRSTDAAKHWTSISVSGLGFGELFYRAGLPVCFQSYGKLNYSQDLGQTWKTLVTLEGKPGRATAFYGKTGIICGGGGMLAISSDRGATWQKVNTQEDVNFTSVLLVNDSVGFLGGMPALLMYTVDAGKTWRKVDNLPNPSDIAALAASGAKLYAVGAGCAIYSARISDILKAPAPAPKPKTK